MSDKKPENSVGMDAVAIEGLLQTHNDLVLSIHKSLIDVYSSVKYNMDVLTEEVKQIKVSVHNVVNDQKYFFDNQERRHIAEIERLMSLMTTNEVRKLPVELPDEKKPREPITDNQKISPKTEDQKKPDTFATDSKQKLSSFGGSLFGASSASPKTSATKTDDEKKPDTESKQKLPSFGGSLFGGSSAVPTVPSPKTSATKNDDEKKTDATDSKQKLTNFGGSIFGASSAVSSPNTSVPKNDDGKKPDAAESKAPSFGGTLFGGPSGQSFASVASKAPNFSFLAPSNQKPAANSGVSAFANSSPVFGDPKKYQIFQQKITTPKADQAADSKANESGGEDEEFVPDAHFEPVIPLPALVETKTGEEDEEVIFVSRCKLYRFDRDAKENKERGVGEIKILMNKKTGRYRCLMRRDQVLKLCANFYILPNMKISPKTGVPSAYTWACKDFSQETQGCDEVFCARFKEVSSAEEFCKKFREAAENSGKESKPSASSAAPSPKTNAPKIGDEKTPDALATEFKQKLPSFGGSTFGAPSGQGTATNKPNFNFLAPLNQTPVANSTASTFASANNSKSAFWDSKNNQESSYVEDEEDDDAEDDDNDYENVNDDGNYDEEDKLLLEEECNLALTDAFVSPMKQAGANKAGPVKCTLRVFETSGVIHVTFTDPKDPQHPLFTHYVYKSSKFVKKSPTIVEYMSLHSTTSVSKNLALTFQDAAALQRFIDHFEDGVTVAKELDFDEAN